MTEEKTRTDERARNLDVPTLSEGRFDTKIRYPQYFGRKIFELEADDVSGNCLKQIVGLSYIRDPGRGCWAHPDFAVSTINLDFYDAPREKLERDRTLLREEGRNVMGKAYERLCGEFFQRNPNLRYMTDPTNTTFVIHASREANGMILNVRRDSENLVENYVLEARDWLQGLIKLADFSISLARKVTLPLCIAEEDYKKAVEASVERLYRKTFFLDPLDPKSFFDEHPVLSTELEHLLRGDDAKKDIPERYETRRGFTEGGMQ